MILSYEKDVYDINLKVIYLTIPIRVMNMNNFELNRINEENLEQIEEEETQLFNNLTSLNDQLKTVNLVGLDHTANDTIWEIWETLNDAKEKSAEIEIRRRNIQLKRATCSDQIVIILLEERRLQRNIGSQLFHDKYSEDYLSLRDYIQNSLWECKSQFDKYQESINLIAELKDRIEELENK